MTREEAIKQIKWYFEEDDGISAEDITKEAVYMAIEALEADRPNGEWIAEEEYGDLWVCDQCGFASEYKDNFCPNCGAKMDGERSE